MSNTIIQIKRSVNTAVPATLAEGELAYSGNGVSNSLFIGLPDGSNTVTRVGGGKYGFLHNANTGNSTVNIIQGGTLTANAVLITDANSSVNELRSTKLVINTSGNTVNGVESISVFANTTQLGANAGGSNTELVTSNAIKTFVDGATAALGGAVSNTQVVFSNSGVFTGTAGFTFNNTTNTVFVSNTISVGTEVAVNTSSFFVGNSTVNTVITSSSIDVDGTLAAGNTTIAGFANISGTLASGNTTVTGFANVSGTLDVGNNVTITGTANVSGNLNVGTDLAVDGNTTIGSNSSDIITINALLSSNVIPSANLTHNLGSSTLRFAEVFAGNVVATNASFNDLAVSGNLIVSGTLTTIDTENLVIEDSLIKLARNNEVDIFDIGFYGKYANTPSLYAGLFRDASDLGTFKLFEDLEPSPNTTVDTSNATYTIATLETFLRSGILTTNSSALAITSNGSYSASITANSVAANVLTVTGSSNNDIFFANGSGSFVALSLGVEGKVLQSNGTAVVYADLDGGTF